MQFLPHHLYHIYNQGNNKQKIFHTEDDYQTFLNLYKRLFPGNCSTIAWCLMPNHFHFMIHTDEKCTVFKRQGGNLLNPVSNAVRKLLSGYARIYNSRYRQTGSIFRQKTKAKCLTQVSLLENTMKENLKYAVTCFHYIHQNPLAAGLCRRAESWNYSSFREYAGLNQYSFCDKEMAARFCGYIPGRFAEDTHQRFLAKKEKGDKGI